MFHGWYSVKQQKVGGSCHYRRANGEIVEITTVSRSKDHGTGWDDMAYVGEVEEFVDKVSDGLLDGLDKLPPEIALSKMLAIAEQMQCEEEQDKKPGRWN